MFCISLFVLLYFFFWPLCCLFFFEIRILIAPLVSSNSSYKKYNVQTRHAILFVIIFNGLYLAPTVSHIYRIKSGPSWPWLHSSWIYNYLCNQCLSPLKLWLRTLFMASVTCDRSVVFSWYSGFLHQWNWSPRYRWNIVESGVKYHRPNRIKYATLNPQVIIKTLTVKNSIDLLVFFCLFFFIFLKRVI